MHMHMQVHVYVHVREHLHDPAYMQCAHELAPTPTLPPSVEVPATARVHVHMRASLHGHLYANALACMRINSDTNMDAHMRDHTHTVTA